MIGDTQSGRRLGLICTIGAIALVTAALGGCETRDPRTQVMLIVDADSDVRAIVTSVEVDVEGRTGSGDAAVSRSTNTFGPMDTNGVTWPYRIALVPRSGDVKRLYLVTATAYVGSDPVGVLRAESGFVARKTIELELKFEASCLRAKSLDCAVTDTCAKGACVAARIDQGTLPMYDGDPRDVTVPEADGGLPPTGTTSGPIMTVAGAGGSAGSGGRVATGSGGRGGTMGGAGAPVGDPSVPGDCGDGKLTGDETCDSAIAPSQPGACPTECSPASACEPTQLEGSGCHTRCTPHTITALESGDGCCPAGADANSDTDCGSQCGNGSIETGEACDPVATCPTTETCVSANVCLKAVVVGDPNACNATCQMQPIIECASGDGCCPASCSRSNDNDCSASCGDGVVDFNAGELCEAQNAERPCPTSCPNADACTIGLFTGSVNNCNSFCTQIPILSPFGGDGCCPIGANANNDSDCQPRCGNGTVERDERCDRNCPSAANCDDGNPCTLDGLTGSECSVACTHTAITAAARAPDGCCPAGANANSDGDCQPVCGNGEVESGEVCDGRCPTPQSCNDNQACTGDVITGSGCGRVCTHPALGPSGATKDGCCPGNMRSDTDADCPAPDPVCGNGVKEGTEACDPPGAPCPACTDTTQCTREVVGGSACNPTCDHVAITAPAPGDGCCPSGANANNDADCTADCGNGVKEGTEECDPPQAPCPACTDANQCTREVVGGSDCNPTCMHVAITAPAPNDGCCPSGANANTDSDCTPVCGNGVVEAGEACDGGAMCSETCTLIVEPMAGSGAIP
jgi:hypothetical protein